MFLMVVAPVFDIEGFVCFALRLCIRKCRAKPDIADVFRNVIMYGLLETDRRGQSHICMTSSFSEAYPALRALARSRLRAGRNTLLDTTSLVHESYIRLAESGPLPEDRSCLLQYAARAMRNVVVDGIRRRCAARHGGGAGRFELVEETASARNVNEDQIFAVHCALERLETVDPRLARGVEMRYFGGFTEPEIAEALGITERTVRRDWEKARLLLAESLA
jgi:RNA polymerase sigma factor (TIGR02999 family)